MSHRAQPGGPTVCVAVVSRNEADLLPACLARVMWADQLLVLDMESTDTTQDLARAHGARVVPVPFVPIAERIRQIAVDATTCDWLLFVDPDELLPESFPVETRPHLLRSDVAAYRIPFREVAFGVPLDSSFPGARKLALMRPESASYDPACPAHQEPAIAGRILDLVDIEPVEHHSRRDVASAADKTFRYGVSGGVATVGVSPLDVFLLPRLWFRAVVLRGAWRDGRAGIAAVSLVAIGEYLGALTQWEASGCPDPRLPVRTRLGLRLLSAVRRGSQAGTVRRRRGGGEAP